MNALQAHDHGLLTEAAWVVGVDEAGRGALAGPVMAGACVLSARLFESEEALRLSSAINDSKQLSAADRDTQYSVLEQLKGAGMIDFEVAEGSVEEIAELNILGATRLAMRRAMEALQARATAWTLPEMASDGPLFANSSGLRVIVDGRPLKPFPYSHTGIVKGDGTSLSIAMASIAAKVRRDRIMVELCQRYPAYGFSVHKGYGTATHRRALNEVGPSECHRALFLRKVLVEN